MYTPTCPFWDWESGESKIVMMLQAEGSDYKVNQSIFYLFHQKLGRYVGLFEIP